MAPLASGTHLTIGHGHGIHIDQIPPVRETTIAVITPSPDKTVYNEYSSKKHLLDIQEPHPLYLQACIQSPPNSR